MGRMKKMAFKIKGTNEVQLTAE